MEPFEFIRDLRPGLLAVTVRGYWDMATCAAYADAFRLQLRRMKARGGCRHCLVDASDFAVQSADIGKALQALVDGFAPDCPERMAASPAAS